MGIVTGYLSQLVSSGIKLLVGGTEVSSSNPLPVETQTVQSLTASATLADTISDCSITLRGQTIGSFTLLTSNDANLSLTLYAVVGDVERNISFCSPNFYGAVYGSISLAANTPGFYTFEIPSGATSVKLKLLTRASGSVALNLYASTGNISQVSLRGNAILGASTSRVGFMAHSAVWTRESTTPVNANLTITGAAKTTFATSSGTALNTTTSYGDKFAAAAGANVTGTLIIDASPDSGTTYYPVASVALTQIGGAGNFGAYLETPIIEATMRARLVNGASNQANAYLTTKMLG